MNDDRDEAEDSNIYMHLLKYKGTYYAAEIVEVTADTVYFQVDASLVRQGLFAKNRLDMRWFKEMGIELIPVYHAPLMEQ